MNHTTPQPAPSARRFAGVALLVCLAALVLGAAPANASDDAIIAVKENGRTVYIDAPTARPQPPRHASSVLVYWSRSERRWKRVPQPSHTAMRAARSAAADIQRALGAAPARSSDQPMEPGISPDNQELIGSRAITSAELDRIIADAAARHNVDPNLVRAVIKVESNFNPTARSRKGAMGLMQLMPGTARSLKVSNPYDPEQNVDAGVRHLKQLLDTYDGDLNRSLAAYNAGSGAVDRNHGVPPYRETRDYVRKIKTLYGAGDGQYLTGPTSAPIRVYRGPDGVLVITNE